MGKEEQRIIVVHRNKLFGNDYFEGFREHGEVDYASRINEHFEVMRRGSTDEPAEYPDGNAELDFMYKQPISYLIVVNPYLKKILAYQRSSSDKNYTEKRLQGKWSWGFGGHIEPFDTKNGDMLRESALREISEELEFTAGPFEPKILGYVNYDSDSVGKVHFGILYLVPAIGTNMRPKDKEIETTRFLSMGELEELCNSTDVEVEGWSKIALEPLRKLL